jgi:hypothetical protein
MISLQLKKNTTDIKKSVNEFIIVLDKFGKRIQK